MKTKRNKTACITGATSGIGAAYAEDFAKQGYNLIITGRRANKINQFAAYLTQTYKVKVKVILADFSEFEAVELLASQIKNMPDLEVLVNNAGYGSEGYFHEGKSSAELAKLQVSDSTAIKLCHAVIPNMIKAGKGIIINVSSISACFPVPGAAMYSATRAFLLSFTESLHLELAGTGVKVQVICPGTTQTDFHEKLGFDPKDYYKNRGFIKALTARQVIKASLTNLKKDKVICIPGGINYFAWVVFKLIPRKLTYKIVQLMIKKRQEFKRLEKSSDRVKTKQTVNPLLVF